MVVERRPRVNWKLQPAEAGEWEEVLLRNETHSPVLPIPVFFNEIIRCRCLSYSNCYARRSTVRSGLLTYSFGPTISSGRTH